MHEVYAKSILSPKNGMNIYRGCSHGCIYCDSRSKCYGMKHEFEDIEVKINAPELLEQALRKKKNRCMIGTGAMCDPYLHIEEKLRLTRRCLELIDRYGFGLSILTKSARILRDLDLLQSINDKAKCVVQMTLTTHDEQLCRIVECASRFPFFLLQLPIKTNHLIKTDEKPFSEMYFSNSSIVMIFMQSLKHRSSISILGLKGKLSYIKVSFISAPCQAAPARIPAAGHRTARAPLRWRCRGAAVPRRRWKAGKRRRESA